MGCSECVNHVCVDPDCCVDQDCIDLDESKPICTENNECIPGRVTRHFNNTYN